MKVEKSREPNYPQRLTVLRADSSHTQTHRFCEGVGDVIGDEAPLGGVAQVIFQGVQVVEVGVQVREHQDRRVEEDGEGQVGVEREVEEIREKHTCATCG